MKIDDVTIGTGPAVENGDTVAVHYVGTLQDGTEFDSSVKRGTPFEFTVGAGQVIQGWEEGVVGMQVGGKRVLVIPPAMAYGEVGFPPVIPPSATLVFTIELLAIN
ncbi:FKBP-type peptidyl-prolyl cis-trans isomerase [Candidatus Kaiserbacteria bacterium]|nr:FKBP-type peptidyl-prolyl cis-trans isomerase [Candidatus Kaiserbacteria bacterium]